jgi:hypothetical protein
MTTAIATTTNPGHLKIDLALRGVRLAPNVRGQIDLSRTLPRVAGSSEDIELVLPDDVWASVPVDDDLVADSPYVLSEQDHSFVIEGRDGRVDVRLVPPPDFYKSTTASGLPMWKVGKVYGSFLAVHPDTACGYSMRGAPCSFCAGGEPSPPEHVFTPSIDDVTDVVRAAFAEGAAEFVYFNLGYTGTEGGGIEFLEPYIRAVKRNFDTAVAVQLHPPADHRWIDRTYAIGVDALNYSIEVHDPELLAQYFPGRAQRIGRARYYEALQHAARIFPSGTVWSELIVGLEPIASTLRAIDTLTAIGVLPVLSLRRAERSPAAEPAWTLDTIAPVYEHLFHAVRQAKINMGWVRDLSFAVTPLEARFFAGDDARVTVALQHFYRSKLGNMAARNLSRLRRRLRVRRVSDSFDSSHL